MFFFFCLSFTPKTADMCCAVTEPNKKARHFGWRHHQAGVLCVLESWKTTFLNPEKFPFWKALLSFDSNNRMFCFFFFLRLNAFFFFFTVAVQNLIKIHLSPQKINCYRLQHLPPIHHLALCLFSLWETFVFPPQLYRIGEATSVLAGDTLKFLRKYMLHYQIA